MSRIHIVNPIERDFGMVPRALWQADLPFAAKGVAAYLFCLRDGAVPYVAEIEAALGLGRDARRKAFAALEAAGVIEWVIERNARNAIVSKTLVLHPLRVRATENQADGKNPVPVSRAPEKPSDGKSTPVEVETRPCIDGKSGDLLRERKKERAAAARSRLAASPRPALALGAGGTVAALSAFVLHRIRAEQPVLIGTDCIKPGSPEFHALRQAVRVQDAEKRGEPCPTI